MSPSLTKSIQAILGTFLLVSFIFTGCSQNRYNSNHSSKYKPSASYLKHKKMLKKNNLSFYMYVIKNEGKYKTGDKIMPKKVVNSFVIPYKGGRLHKSNLSKSPIKIILNKDNKFSLKIYAPHNSKIYIQNIKPKYYDYIRLKKATYKIKVVKKGYTPYYENIYLNKDTVRYIKLKKITHLIKTNINTVKTTNGDINWNQ